jgi:regulatory protein
VSNYDDFSRAKYAAFFYLGRKALTESELRQKLRKKEYPPEVCEKTIDYLKELSYIDDTDYAARYAKDAAGLKKHGAARIQRDLARKGISPEIAEHAVASLEIDDGENLRSIIEKKRERLDLADAKQKNRLIGYLARRGYRYDEIYSALRETEEADFD